MNNKPRFYLEAKAPMFQRMFYRLPLRNQIKALQYARAYATTTPCNQSRNKREGKYGGKTVFEWQYVTGWGMCGYQGEPRHHRTSWRPLRKAGPGTLDMVLL